MFTNARKSQHSKITEGSVILYTDHSSEFT